MPDEATRRYLALDHAVDLYRNRFDGNINTILAAATALLDWLNDLTSLLIHIGTIVDQTTKQPTGNPSEGTSMQLHDNEEVDLTVTVASAKGSPIPDDPATTGDDLIWSVGDTSVASLVVSDDTRTCTVAAGVVGSTIARVELGDLFATLAIDILPGEAALLTISEGVPRDQDVPTP